MRFLPNTAADLEPVLALLERLRGSEVRIEFLLCLAHHHIRDIAQRLSV